MLAKDKIYLVVLCLACSILVFMKARERFQHEYSRQRRSLTSAQAPSAPAWFSLFTLQSKGRQTEQQLVAPTSYHHHPPLQSHQHHHPHCQEPHQHHVVIGPSYLINLGFITIHKYLHWVPLVQYKINSVKILFAGETIRWWYIIMSSSSSTIEYTRV